MWDPWRFYDFWAIRGNFGEEEKKAAIARNEERLRQDEFDFWVLTWLAGLVALLGLSLIGKAIYRALF